MGNNLVVFRFLATETSSGRRARTFKFEKFVNYSMSASLTLSPNEPVSEVVSGGTKEAWFGR